MNQNDIEKIFLEKGALHKGHFLLSSGLHSDTYFQSALILQYPDITEKLAIEIKNKIIKQKINFETVVSPALGGIVIGYEVARALRCRAIFLERVDSKLILRRGFEIKQNEKCLVVEDVITTGLSSKEVIEVVKANSGKVVGIASIVDRSGGKAEFDVPKVSLINIEVKNYDPKECPLCKQGLALIKPGSRKK